MTFGLLGGANGRSSSDGGSGGVTISGDDVRDDIREIKYTIWLDEYKSFGEDSHVFNNKDNWAELMQSNAALNDKTISTMAFDFLLENDIDPMTAMGNIYGTGINFKQYETFKEVCMDADNVQKIIEHPVLSEIVYAHQSSVNDLFDINTSGIWDIMTLELADVIVTKDAFLKYMETLPLITTQTSVPNGKYFLVKVDTTGRKFSSSTDNVSYTVEYYGGHSGASYKNYGDAVVNIQTAQDIRPENESSNSYDQRHGGIPAKTHQIGKLCKEILLTTGGSYQGSASISSDGQWGYGGYTRFKSTAYYRVLHT